MQITFASRSTRSLALFCVFALLAGCSSSPARVAAPPVPTSTTEILAPTAEAHRANSPTAPSVPGPTTAPRAEWPTTEWQTSSPEAQGMDSHKLAEMLKAIEERGLNLHSLLIIRHGYLISENYFGHYQADTQHELYSVTKSFIATLIGSALDRGHITGTDQRVVDFFPERTFDNLDSQKAAMTLDDVLTMRTGLDWEEGNPAYRDLYISPDWLEYMLDKPLDSAPGTQFNYCSGCSHVLSAIVQETTGTNPRDFAEQVLFKPLGITNMRWDANPAGTPIGGWGLWLTPRDMAKLGYLYLRHGEWDGQQIISSAWVENATRTHTATDGELGYGYQWWTFPDLKAYAALGLDGQTVLVIPELDLIVVTTAQTNGHDEIIQLVRQYILPAVQDAQSYIRHKDAAL
jgi:CubicO group peptidase (beta-lactamase class C family)